jgi:hypothetical protein
MEKQTVIEDINTRNTEISSSIEFLSASYDTLLNQVTDLKNENKLQLQYIHTLEDKLETFERGTRSTCLEIKNIPNNKPESKETLIKLVSEIGNSLHCNTHTNDIKDIFRIKSRNSDSRTVMVDFVSVISKDALLKAYKNTTRDHQS